MKSTICIIATVLLLNVACSNKSTKTLNGTWQLVSSEVNANGAITLDKMEGKKMIKIINATHFAFLNHDLKAGKDSTNIVFVAGGGTCTRTDSTYSETLEYCNYRDYEGLKVDFKVQFAHDTLILSGHEVKEDLNVDQYITEKYIKIGG